MCLLVFQRLSICRFGIRIIGLEEPLVAFGH